MIAQNQRTKEAVLHEAIDHFSRDFRAACQSQGRLADAEALPSGRNLSLSSEVVHLPLF